MDVVLLSALASIVEAIHGVGRPLYIIENKKLKYNEVNQFVELYRATVLYLVLRLITSVYSQLLDCAEQHFMFWRHTRVLGGSFPVTPSCSNVSNDGHLGIITSGYSKLLDFVQQQAFWRRSSS